MSLGPLPTGGTTAGVVELRGDAQIIGRLSISRNIAPDIDCSPDTGVSRRHAGLQVHEGRLYVEDLGSANGTFLARPGEPVPDLPITPGLPVEVDEGDRIYLGAWSRLVVRRLDAETTMLDSVTSPSER